MVSKLTYKNIIILIIILIIHYSLLNGLEKIFLSQFNIPYLVRPSDVCKNIKDELIVGCIGMPSGHAEIVSIFAYILYKYKYISIDIFCLFILVVCSQRVIYKKHTIIQVVVGVIIGLFYGMLYLKTKLTFISMCIPLFFVTSISLVILFIIDTKINNSHIPFWVDTTMYSKINEKKNSNLIIKLFSVITPSYEQNRFVYIEWDLL